jgi:MFS superfamily sulfate permease-like transporter
VLALWGVLLIDVLQGMVIGLVASLLFVVYRTARPHIASLGRVQGAPGVYSDVSRHSDATPVPGVLIVRPDAQLYYANALTVRDEVKAMIEDAQSPPKAVVFDMAAQDGLDLTSGELFASFVRQLQGRAITVYLADVHRTVLEDARGTGLLDAVGEDHVFPTTDAAVNHVETDA